MLSNLADKATRRTWVDAALGSFLAERTADLARVDPSLTRLVHELRAMVFAGGKRVRPLLAVWGYIAAGHEPDLAMARAAAALELVHCFALVQDDIMDGSRQRRGRPATHKVLGQSGALLASDLALIWADRLLLESGFEGRALARAFEILREGDRWLVAWRGHDLTQSGSELRPAAGEASAGGRGEARRAAPATQSPSP